LKKYNKSTPIAGVTSAS